MPDACDFMTDLQLDIGAAFMDARASRLAMPADPMIPAAAAAKVPVVDLTDLFCDERTCFGQVGDVIVYKDSSHLSTEYSTMLAQFVDERLGPVPG